MYYFLWKLKATGNRYLVSFPFAFPDSLSAPPHAGKFGILYVDSDNLIHIAKLCRLKKKNVQNT